ncbi:MAG TPA: hypothetical protein VGO84_08850 [Burkholderiales bacterium]|jgi:hypothetical protein|nr:hypothetical protein [Burkholderiales bacterium]
MRTITAALIACAGFAFVPLANAQLFSATRDVIAIAGGNLFIGEAEGHLNGGGTLAIHAQNDPALICRGDFTSSAALGGSGQLRCSDGSVSTFKFARLTTFTGHGKGSFGASQMSFVYGLSAADAGPYLKLPEGKKLTHNGAELALADL